MELSLRIDAVLTRSLVDHFSTVPPREMPKLLRLIARFCSRIFAPREYETHVKKLRPATRLQARAWKRWALSSYYWGQLWRCVVSGESPDKWGVYYEDVNLVMSNLAPSDKPKLKRVSKTISLEHFEEGVFDQMRRVLMSTAWKTYHAKLRFLTKYDPAMAPQDFVAEMVEVGIKALRRYEETASEEIALAYAKKAVRNHALIIINHYTAGRRCRIEQQEGGEREYRYRIINSSSVTNSIPSHQDEVLFSTIRLWLGQKYERYARAVIQQEPAFEAWVQKRWVQRGRKTSFPKRPKTICRLAREWSGLSEAQVQGKLVPLLQDRLQDHLALSQPM